MGRGVLVALAVLGCAHISRAQSSPPPTLTPEGSAALALVGHAARSDLAGVERLYDIALYAKAPFDQEQLRSERAAKALRIEVTYERDWHRPPVVGWQRELVPRIEPAAATHLEGAFAPLRRGDIVLIEYTPQKGTMVHINRDVAVWGARHDLMLAFLDHWLGQRPVSEEIKRALLGRS